MYSTSPNKTSFPRYADYSTRGNELLEAIDRPTNPPQPQYRIYPPQQTHQTFSESSVSNDAVSLRTTNTQDLAEFLRTSSPADFQKFLNKNPSEEQLFSFGSYRKSFKFLRATGSKSRLKAVTALPNTVFAMKTSRGKPYLQIHVDYNKAHCHAQIQSPLVDDRLSNYGTSEFSSDFTFRDSVLGASTLTSPPPSSTEERVSLSPAPWGSSDSSKTLDADTMATYHQYLYAEQDIDAFNTGNGAEPNPRSLSIEAVGGEGVKMSEYRKSLGDISKRHSDPNAYSSSPQNTISINTPRRSSSLHNSRSSAYSSTGDEFVDSDRDGVQPHRKHNRRAPPRPGPPPARCLPALPKPRGPSSVSTAGEFNEPRSLFSTSASFASSISSHYQAADESDTIQDRKQKVKARKARDMQQARLRRQATMNQEAVSTHSSRGAVGLHIVTNGKSPKLSTHQPPRLVPVAGNERTLRNKNRGTPTPPNSPSIHLEPVNNKRKTSLFSATLPSPTISSTKSYHSQSQSDLGSDIESRIQAVERKNRMLEKALIAVIRGTVGNDHRQAGLQRANSLEDLLQELKMVDTTALV